MTAIILPTTSMPGQRPQESGGRLINCFAESLGETAGTPLKLLRAPGLSRFGTTNETVFRGGFQLGALVYTAWSGKVNTHTQAGGVGADLAGALPGDEPVFFARNNKTTPDLVIVSPDNGAFIATTSAVSAYPDADVGAPSSVCFLKGYFIFGYGTGAMRASGLNVTSINTLDTATAESKPDTLYRVLARGDTLIAAGSESIEFWGINGEATGFPFSPITTLDRGIVGRTAIGGHEEGFGHGIFFVADDFTVRQLEGYASIKISPPDLDRLIEAESDKGRIQVSVYVTQGHPFVVVQGEDVAAVRQGLARSRRRRARMREAVGARRWRRADRCASKADAQGADVGRKDVAREGRSRCGHRRRHGDGRPRWRAGDGKNPAGAARRRQSRHRQGCCRPDHRRHCACAWRHGLSLVRGAQGQATRRRIGSASGSGGMTTTLAILGAYLAAGIGVALFAKRDRWIENIRWWHVVFWPVIPLHYGLVTLLFWMAGRNR